MFKNKFQTKKITETFKVGDYLRRRREEINLSIKEISQKLGIKCEYLDNLENGNYQDLPPQVYVRGFIKNYASFLGLDGNQLIKIYNREISFANEELAPKKNNNISGRTNLLDYFIITPKLITFFVSLFIVSILGYYFMHQINSFNSKPYLFVESPTSDEVVEEKDLWVNGQTEKDAILKINGQDISVGADGKFSQKITLGEGRNSLVIEAKNRFNKSERREINVVYEKAEGDNKIIVEESDVKPITSAEEVVKKNGSTVQDVKDANAEISGQESDKESNNSTDNNDDLNAVVQEDSINTREIN